MDERKTQQTQQTDILTELPIDLQREEYVMFCTLLDRVGGAWRARLIAAVAMEMLGLMLMIAAAVGIVVLLVLIIKFKLHPVFVLVLHFFAWVRLIRKRKTIQMINNFLLVLLENRNS